MSLSHGFQWKLSKQKCIANRGQCKWEGLKVKVGRLLVITFTSQESLELDRTRTYKVGCWWLVFSGIPLTYSMKEVGGWCCARSFMPCSLVSVVVCIVCRCVSGWLLWVRCVSSCDVRRPCSHMIQCSSLWVLARWIRLENQHRYIQVYLRCNVLLWNVSSLCDTREHTLIYFGLHIQYIVFLSRMLARCIWLENQH